MSSRPEPTHLVRRSLASLVDYLLMFGLTVGYFEVQPWAHPDATGNYGAVGCLVSLPLVAVWVVYFAGGESRFGRTLGKGLFDLKVERLDGRRADFSHCLKRHILDPIDFFFYGAPALIAVKVSPTRQRLGDMWAGTRVVMRRYVESRQSNAPIA